jgi:hypothetical protein
MLKTLLGETHAIDIFQNLKNKSKKTTDSKGIHYTEFVISTEGGISMLEGVMKVLLDLSANCLPFLPLSSKKSKSKSKSGIKQ